MKLYFYIAVLFTLCGLENGNCSAAREPLLGEASGQSSGRSSGRSPRLVKFEVYPEEFDHLGRHQHDTLFNKRRVPVGSKGDWSAEIRVTDNGYRFYHTPGYIEIYANGQALTSATEQTLNCYGGKATFDINMSRDEFEATIKELGFKLSVQEEYDQEESDDSDNEGYSAWNAMLLGFSSFCRR